MTDATPGESPLNATGAADATDAAAATNVAASPADGRKIVVRTETQLESGLTELEIAVTTELAPAMVLALLSTTAAARSNRDELEPSLEVLGAAVVRSSAPEKVRLQLLFDKGAVLPIELTTEAAQALAWGLDEYLGSSKRRFAVRREDNPI